MVQLMLRYHLSDGFLHHWLVAGPLQTPGVDQKELLAGTNEVTEQPVDLGGLGAISQENPQLTWRCYRTREDHWVDFSTSCPSRATLRGWAFAQIDVPQESTQTAGLVLSAIGAAELWVNGKMCCQLEATAGSELRSVQSAVDLQPGLNDILIRMAQAGVRAVPLAAALRVTGLSDAQVVLPTNIEPEYAALREILEEVADHAYLERYVYGYPDGDRYNKNEPITMRFDNELQAEAEITYRLQSLQGDIFQEGTKVLNPLSVIEMARTFPLRNGPHHLGLVPPSKAYYIHNLRFERKHLFHVVRTPYTIKAAEDFTGRAKEALEDAAQRRTNSIFTELARMCLDQWDALDRKVIQQTIDRMKARQEGSVIDLLGLAGILTRFGRRKVFPKDLKAPITEAIVSYRYSADEPGDDGMDFASESRQLLFATCEIIAGQLYPERSFASGKSGREHREHGEAAASAWLRQHGMWGFREWNAPAAMEETIAALSTLLELALSDSVCDLAAVMMDKLLFNLAYHSLQGAFGSTRGASTTASLFSARLEETSGIARLMWGQGNFNESITATVSLANIKNYEVPPTIAQIARVPDATWSREQQTLPDGSWSVNAVSYRTADTLLSSALDYHPGEKGSQEHIWQATLGPDAVVFVNHPANMSEDDALQPNLWRGNAVLPRVAQWGDVLIAIHQLPEDDWLGYTHAYFPTAAFDEYHFQDGWAFARRGRGYIALKSSQGFELINKGQTAMRELRSPGKQTVWVCHMGHELLDGDYTSFRLKILAMDLTFDGPSARLHSLRGEDLAFGWQGPFLVNQAEQPLSDFPHVENPFCVAPLPATQMDIIYGEDGVRLKFE